MTGHKRHKLIIDCDPGHDDAIALILAHSIADVVGITTVSGNAPLLDVTANALAIVDLIGVETPVHSGASRPLSGPARHAERIHGATGLEGARLEKPKRDPASKGAVDYLLSASREHPDCWLVAIGPLTNVALAIQADPAFAGRIAGISIMGGSTERGNVTPSAEFNIWADPVAADMVFASSARIKLCGLNLTRQLKTSDDLIAELRAVQTSCAEFAADLFEFLHGRMQELIGERAASLHDPCAVLAVVAEDLFEFAEKNVSVDTSEGEERGKTRIETPVGSRAGSVRVAYRIDAAAAMEKVVSALA